MLNQKLWHTVTKLCHLCRPTNWLTNWLWPPKSEKYVISSVTSQTRIRVELSSSNIFISTHFRSFFLIYCTLLVCKSVRPNSKEMHAAGKRDEVKMWSPLNQLLWIVERKNWLKMALLWSVLVAASYPYINNIPLSMFFPLKKNKTIKHTEIRQTSHSIKIQQL